MPSATKIVSVQSYQMILYRRALHPEFFALKGRRGMQGQTYDLELWVMPGGHLVRFQHRALCVSELLTRQTDGLPTEGVVTGGPTGSERDYEHRFASEGVHYMSSTHSETLSDSIFQSTYDEVLELGSEPGGLMHRWDDRDHGKALSVINIQRFSREAHVQCYHLIGSAGFVLRTQTLIEHR